LAEVEDTGVDGDLLGRLEGALDLVHCGDAVRLFGVDEIDVRGDMARPLPASAVAEVERLVECGSDAGVAEPCGDVADGRAVAVVEVVAGGEDFDGLCAAVVKGVEQAGVQALLEEDVGGQGGSHHYLRYRSGASQVASIAVSERFFRFQMEAAVFRVGGELGDGGYNRNSRWRRD